MQKPPTVATLLHVGTIWIGYYSDDNTWHHIQRVLFVD